MYSPGGFHSGVETHFVVGNKGNVRIKVNDLKTTPGAETPGSGIAADKRVSGAGNGGSEFAAGLESSAVVYRQTEEAGFIASGRFDIEIDGCWYRLAEGDSFRFQGKPFRWRNPGKSAAIVIWVTSPPVY